MRSNLIAFVLCLFLCNFGNNSLAYSADVCVLNVEAEAKIDELAVSVGKLRISRNPGRVRKVKLVISQLKEEVPIFVVYLASRARQLGLIISSSTFASNIGKAQKAIKRASKLDPKRFDLDKYVALAILEGLKRSLIICD